MIIRPERPADFDRIRELVTAAFESDVEAGLVDAIRAHECYRPDMSFVATDEEGTILGHVMVDSCLVRSTLGDRPTVMLSPLAVLPAVQRRGIGTALIETAADAANRAGEPILLLEGSPTYYGKRGFVFAGDHGLTLPIPDWAPREAAQVRLLSSYDPSDASLRGEVVYPKPFLELD